MMNLTDKPLPNPAVILRDDFDDYVLLFEPSIGQVVGLDAVGVATWRAIDGQRTIADIADIVRAQFDGAPPSIIADVCALVADLERQLFVLTEPLTVTDPSPGDFGSLNRPPRLNGEIYTLALADGTRLALGAEDATAARVVAQFAAWMRLAPATTLDGFRCARFSFSTKPRMIA